jgi:lipopolysaccharide/colanic/teichoic acid biosynthesis glycosyltransferase
VLSPLLLFVAACIKLTSRGTILYRQIRMGKNAREFHILKFRSMMQACGPEHLRITVAGDARVTPFGKLIRRYKIDELPQLWNVVRGEMSLVGPRPELPAYLAEYTLEQRRVLTVRPGITDPASLAYRHEEELLSGDDDPEQFYRTRILPDKLARNLAYLESITLAGDLRIIFRSIASAFQPSRNK